MLNVRCPRRIDFFDTMHIRDVCCGAGYSLVLTVEGALYSFGYGDGEWLMLQPQRALPQVICCVFLLAMFKSLCSLLACEAAFRLFLKFPQQKYLFLVNNDVILGRDRCPHTCAGSQPARVSR